MINAIMQFLGIVPETDYAGLVENGAIVVDVRSNEEFRQGHIKGAINIPLDHINNWFNTLENKNQLIITCCASGLRSRVAQNILKLNGFPNVYNGGGWIRLGKKINDNEG